MTETNNTLTILVAIVLVLAGINLFATMNLSSKIDDIAIAPSGAQPTAPVAPAAKVEGASIDDDPMLGNKNAKVTIIEFSDFECPFCAKFYSETMGQIKTEYIDTGKVKLVYRDFPLSFHANAQKAAEASECADDQKKFWEMHDLLFEKGVVGGVTTFKQYAVDLGLDTDKFNKCLDSGEKATEVQNDMKDGQSYGISGTPGFLVNGVRIVGAQPFSAFKAVIDAELAK